MRRCVGRPLVKIRNPVDASSAIAFIVVIFARQLSLKNPMMMMFENIHANRENQTGASETQREEVFDLFLPQ